MPVEGFLTVSYFDAAWKLLLIVFVTFIQRHICFFFFRDRFNLFAASLIGLAINASILAILVSFNMYLAHIFQTLVFISLIAIECIVQINFFRAKKSKSLLRVFKFNNVIKYFMILNIIQIYFFNSRNSKIVEAHWAYYFGIPAEILKGTYNDRLKIFDNFPVEYPKFHFFNGSEIAILMKPLGNVVFADYALAKLVIISAFAALGLELVHKKSQSNTDLILFTLFMLMALTILNTNLLWALNSSNYSSIAYFMFFLIASLKNSSKEQVIWLSIFSITSVRSVFPAMVILIYLALRFNKYQVDNKIKLNYNLKYCFLFFVLIANWFVLFFTGVSPEPVLLNYIKAQISIPYINLVNPGWLPIMSTEVFSSSRYSLAWCLLWVLTVTLIFSTYGSLVSRSRTLTIFASGLIIMTFILRYFEIPKAIQVSSVILNFIIPVFAVLILVPRNVAKIIYIFLIASFVQIVILDGGQSIPNWALVEWLWLFLFVYRLRVIKLKGTNMIPGTLLMIFAIIFSFSLSKIEVIYQPNLNSDTAHLVLSKKLNLKGKDLCQLDDMSGLLNVLSGNRSYYYESKSDRFSITKVFVNYKFNSSDKELCP